MMPLPPRFTPASTDEPLLGLSSKPARVLADAVNYHRAGTLDRAETLYRLLLERAGEHPDVLHLLGVIGHQTGHQGEALALIDAAITRAASVPDYHNNRGLVLSRLGRADDALASFDRALGINPTFADAMSNRGNVLQELGRLDEAVAAYRQAISINPRHAEAHNNLGNVLRRRGEPLQAVECWQQALSLRPDYHEALTNLGAGLIALDRLEEAIGCLEASLRGRPDHAETLFHLAEALRLAGTPRESQAAAERGLARHPDDTRLQIQKARALSALQRPEEALAIVRRAAVEKPLDVDLQAEFAQMLEYAGDLPGAAQVWRGLLDHRPQNADAIGGLIAIEREKAPADLVQRAEQLAESAAQAPADRRVLHKALGDLRERHRDYAAAMRHYAAANQIRAREFAAQGIAFDPAALAAFVSRQIAAIDGETLRRLQALGSPSARPIFIIGMPRSGTSLCEQILASHGDVVGAGELNEMQTIARTLPRLIGDASAGYPECVRQLGPDSAAEASGRYLARLDETSSTAPHVVDKHPINFRHLGLIAMLFPKAAIVHCRRDPLDTCFSCYAQNFDAPIPWALQQDSLGIYYREYERLMAHWYEIMPGRILDFVYEEVVGDIETSVRRLIAHCGLPWQAQCLEFHQTQRMVRTASHRQVRQPLYSWSVGRWRNYEPFLQPLRRALES
jgi:tetratricopeptide (TPR) repeat protein